MVGFITPPKHASTASNLADIFNKRLTLLQSRAGLALLAQIKFWSSVYVVDDRNKGRLACLWRSSSTIRSTPSGTIIRELLTDSRRLDAAWSRGQLEVIEESDE